MNANAVACNYSLLRFRPYPDGGEFVNVGLVLWCEEADYFGYCCDTRCEERVRAFFPRLDSTIFEKAMHEMAEEIDRVGRRIAVNIETYAPLTEPRSSAQRFIAHFDGVPTSKRTYQELIRHREGLITFGPDAAAMTTDPQVFLEQLVARHLMPGVQSPRDHALVKQAA